MNKYIDITFHTRNNNFSLLHLAGALMVSYGHQKALMGLEDVDLYGMALSTLGVQILFCVSGYLVMKSLIHKPKGFFARRIKRIYPQWIIYLFLMTFIIGPFISTELVRDYYFSHQTWRYFFSNLIFNCEYYLPGVFKTEYLGANVNISIWTLPFEMIGIIAVALTGFFSAVLYNQKHENESGREIFGISSMWMIPIVVLYIFQMVSSRKLIYYIGNVELWGGLRLLAYFAFGSIVSLFSMEKYLKPQIAIILMVVLFYFPGCFSKVFLFPVVAYSILAVGISHPIFPKWLDKYDICYELFIWSFPCQQIVLMIWESLEVNADYRVLWIISVSFAIIMSVLSRLLEKYISRVFCLARIKFREDL